MKELFVWTSSYELGIHLIDEQHKKWLGIMNKLYNAFIRKEAKDVILQIINEMQEYTQYHFSTEERYFKQFGYAKEASHLSLHENFKKELVKFRNEYESNPMSLTYKVMTFMQNWLREHILESDKQYVNTFNGKI
jgi:hemerythrin-like metal-binding protein